MKELITWIAVAERLPDDETTVLVAGGPLMDLDFGLVGIAYHIDGLWWPVGNDSPLGGDNEVTHWAEPPGGPAA